MSDSMTSNSLIESIKRRAHVPENQVTFQAQDFLDFATEELRLGIVPDIMSVHEDYFIYEHLEPLVAGKQEYEIPSRALGTKLKDLQIKLNDNNYSRMTRVGIADRYNDLETIQTSGTRYYVKNNRVIIIDDVGSAPTASLVFVIFIKPSKLVAEDRVGIITAIDRNTGLITLNAVPDNFGLTDTYDFYKSKSPYTQLNIDFNVLAMNSNANTITVDVDEIPRELSVGDHISLSDECIIPQIPGELHAMLAQMVACRLYESQGDAEALQSGNIKLAQMKQAAGMLVDNRVDEAPRKAVAKHTVVRNATVSKRYR